MLNNTKISFELFPSPLQLQNGKLGSVIDHFNQYEPDFFSVTFGAGGSSSYVSSLELVKHLVEKGIEVTAHITCFHLTKKQIFDRLQQYISLGVNKLVVIRGDQPEGEHTEVSFNYAYQLISYIREISGDYFDITIAAYPEFYPESKAIEEDVLNLKQKIEAGADRAITQYFYNIDAFYYFMDLCQKNNINIPIIPGVMPISNYEKLKKFSKICDADIPQWLDKRLSAYADDPVSYRAFCTDVVSKLCEDLIAQGVPGIHFYILNQTTSASAVLDNLRLNRTNNTQQAKV